MLNKKPPENSGGWSLQTIQSEIAVLFNIFRLTPTNISWRYFSPSLALIEWVCNPNNRTPVALCIINAAF